jgi:hypothetical protein
MTPWLTTIVAVAFGGLAALPCYVSAHRDRYGQCNVPAPNAGFVAVAAGEKHSLGLKSDGTIVAWGNNDYGQRVVPSPNSNFVVTATDFAGNEGRAADIQNMTTGVDGATSDVSRLLVLMAPNPSARGVVIRCLLPLRTLTTVALFDASGRTVRRLHEGDLPAGETPLSWDGRDDAGREAPAGVYLVKIATPTGETSGRLVLTR